MQAESWRRDRWRKGWTAAVSLCLAFLMALTLDRQPVFAAPPAGPSVPQPDRGGGSAPVSRVPVRQPPQQATPRYVRTGTAWPVGGAAVVPVDTSAAGAARRVSGAARPGGLPVAVRAGGASDVGVRSPEDLRTVLAAAPTSVTVAVAAQSVAEAAGIAGVVFTVTRADSAKSTGYVALDFDYAGFKDVYGGNFGGRLRLVRLPACALTTPSVPDCRLQTPVPGAMNVETARVVSVDALAVSGTPSVLALAATSSSQQGDFTKTSLSPAYSWAAGLQGGGFSTSIPITVPPSLGGPAPSLELTYSSSSVDGLTLATNSQAGLAGLGWDLPLGYIERSYRSCRDDGTNTGDLCWLSTQTPQGTRLADAVTLVLGNRSTRLVRDDATGTWRPEDDDGTFVERLTGTPGGLGGNYTSDSEYWRVVALDGTQYVFGSNRRYGGDGETHSAQTVPVYSNHAGEPCVNAGGYAVSYCHHGYRWNLDYVMDPRGNEMRIFYAKMVGAYGRNNGNGTADYDINARPIRIEYGMRVTDPSTVPAPMRVDLGYHARCLPEGCQLDVPWDRHCPAGAASCGQTSPTFWTTYGLQTITTRVRNAAGTGYTDVDRWDLVHSYPSPQDGSLPSMWLDSVQKVGLTGPAPLPAPKTLFHRQLLTNRVDYNEAVGALPLNHYRVSAVDSGHGSITKVAYAGQECSRTQPMPDPDWNSKRCFPVPLDGGGFGWFHKYIVDRVIEEDLTGGGPAEEWSYAYSTEGANTSVLWGHDDSEVIPVARRTWSVFRGYSMVTTTHGAAAGTRTVTRKLFYRGLSGDRTDAGDGTRIASIQDSQGNQLNDQRQLAGRVREERSMDAGAMVATTIHEPTATATASRSRPWQGGTQTAYRVREHATIGKVYVAATSTWRTTEVQTGYDSYGLPNIVIDRGDTATAVDDTCTTVSFARTGYRIDYPAERITRAGTTCTSGARVAHQQIFYDNTTTVGAAPTAGLPTRTRTLTAEGSPEQWAVIDTGYDPHGRSTSVKDARGQTSTVAYSPASGAPVRQTTQTNPLNHTVVTALDGTRGQPLTVTDPNNKVTTVGYDGLGRTHKAWLPGRPTSGTPDREYGYLLRTDGANTITTKTLGPTGNQVTSYELFDGRLRRRQTQRPGPQANGGRIITDTAYDTRGLPAKTSTLWNSAAPAPALTSFADTAVHSQTRLTYDNRERVTVEALRDGSAQLWQTVTSYDGDRKTITPPDGGARVTMFDALGRASELRLYPTSAVTGTPETTRYGYDIAGRLTTVADAAGNTIRYTYDLGGRRTRVEDPDTGVTTSGYSAADDLLWTLDARNQKVSHVYDELGRPKSRWAGEVNTGTRVAAYTYDTLAKGRPASATRYSASGDAYVVAPTGYDDRYRPTGTRWTIPVTETGLTGSYDVGYTYNWAGTLATVTHPSRHGLPAETVTLGYDNVGHPTTMTGTAPYVSSTGYTNLGQVAQRVHGATGPAQLVRDYTWQPGTGRLATVTSKLPNTAGTGFNTITSDTYTYTPTGDITSIKDGTDNQSQCYRYDGHHRLTEAWTAVDNCAANPSVGAIAGSGKHPYWDSWTFDTSGRRATDTHRTAAGTVNRTFTYPAVGASRVHAVSSVQYTGLVSRTDSFGYDNAGNMTSRTVASVSSTYTITPEGRFNGATVNATGGAQTTSHLYDADGTLLIRREPSGTTLYIADHEYKKTGSTITATRYYSGVAARTAAGLTWTAGDHQSSANLAVNASTGAVQKRWYTPYGGDRAGATGWPTSHGFLDKQSNESTGLLDVGAREYDPNLGTFISPDPLIDVGDPRSFNPYGYAAGSPITLADPDGLDPCPGGGGGCYYDGSTTARDGVTKQQMDKARQWTQEILSNLAKPGDKPRDGLIWTHDAASHYLMGGRTYNELSVIEQERVDAWIWCQNDPMACAVEHCTPGSATAACTPEMIEWSNQSPAEIDKVQLVILIVLGLASLGITGAAAARPSAARRPYATGPGRRNPAGCAGAANSFTPGTRVLMADGSSIPIEDVRIGDIVLATDPETGQTAAKPVLATITGTGPKTLVEITIDLNDDGDGDDRQGVIIATDRHPIWTTEPGTWRNAIDLHPGQHVRTAAGGNLRITATRVRQQHQQVHNLTIADIHTYYVLAGNTPVLVHNTGPCGPGLVPKGVNNLRDGAHMTTNDALDTAVDFLGPGYQDMGGGRFLSRDGLRQVRMTDADLAHPRQNPHINFETYNQPIGPGVRSGGPASNIHIYLPEEPGWHLP